MVQKRNYSGTTSGSGRIGRRFGDWSVQNFIDGAGQRESRLAVKAVEVIGFHRPNHGTSQSFGQQVTSLTIKVANYAKLILSPKYFE